VGPFIDTPSILRGLGWRGRLPAPLLSAVERLSGVRRLEAICRHAGVTRTNADVPGQIRDVLDAAGIAYDVGDHRNLAAAPSRGPLVFYCNHPFGIADALIGLKLALATRPDTKVLANSVLGAFDINTDHLIWIDPFAGPASHPVNQRGLREALKQLRAGGSLLMFPSGECSSLDLRHGRVADPPWSHHLPRFLSSTGAASVPIHFEGCNSWRFQALGLVHPTLRTLLLLREFVGLRGRRIRVRVGPARPLDARDSRADVQAQSLQLRERVYALASDAARTNRARSVAE
jgi:putative hemolysin